MFRCIAALKGMIIDIDSFSSDPLEGWSPFVQKYKCVFLTAQDENAVKVNSRFGVGSALQIKTYQKPFAPSISIQRQCIQMLDLLPTEVVYVSRDIEFINNAMEFLSGTIWITRNIRYEDASRIADMVSRDLPTLNDDLNGGIKGYIGETALYPREFPRGSMLPTVFLVDKETYPLILLGRYFGYEHYMSQLHPYSSAIYLNKQKGRKYYGIFDEMFYKLYLGALQNILRTMRIDGICSVPPRAGNENRFSGILRNLSETTGIQNYDGLLICNYSYPSQKSLSQREREDNIQGVFQATEALNGETIVLIDDIASTGSTLRECVRVLKNKGAGKIIIIVLAVNQIHESYWSSIPAQVSCPRCGERMHLLVNSRNRRFFYSCYNCRSQTMDFEEGRKLVETLVNRETNQPDDDFSF